MGNLDFKLNCIPLLAFCYLDEDFLELSGFQQSFYLQLTNIVELCTALSKPFCLESPVSLN